jgi:hypothetical protein
MDRIIASAVCCDETYRKLANKAIDRLIKCEGGELSLSKIDMEYAFCDIEIARMKKLLAVSGLFESIREFTDRWFSESADIIVGALRPNTRYMVYDYEPDCVVDIIIDDKGVRYYLCEVFYPSDHFMDEVIDIIDSL